MELVVLFPTFVGEEKLPVLSESFAVKIAEGNEPVVVKVTVYVPPKQKCVLLTVVEEIVCALVPFKAKNNSSSSKYLLLGKVLN